MKTIKYKKIVEAVSKLPEQIACDLPGDVLEAIEAAVKRETNPRAVNILNQLIENARIAREDRIPLCQDTGLAIVFCEQGADVIIAPPAARKEATLYDAINEAIAKGYEEGLLRKSVVAEPLDKRKNTTTNTPAVIHHSVVPGDELSITVMTKGGGCENKSQFKMFNPTEERQIEFVCYKYSLTGELNPDGTQVMKRKRQFRRRMTTKKKLTPD